MKLQSPVIAILRGVTADRAESVALALYGAGIRMIEVTFNSPDPLLSIKTIVQLRLQDCLVGAGTVINQDDVQRIYDTGGKLIVTPNCDVGVTAKAVKLGMMVLPGVATATEAFAAIQAGAQQLKLFPAATYGTKHLKALKSVLPAHIKIFPVGGIGASDIPEWKQAGADGFGFGSELFKPDYSLEDIAARARQIMDAYHASYV